MPRKYAEDPKLGSWVETQRNLYNRQCKTKLKSDSGSSSNEESVGPTEAAALPAKTPEEWAEEMDTSTGDAMAVDMDGQVEAAAMEVVNEVTASEKPAAIVEETAEGEMADGKVKSLTPERKEKLEALGFVWSLRSKRTDDHWDEMYRQLVEYKEKHGVSTKGHFVESLLDVAETNSALAFIGFAGLSRTFPI